MDKIYSRFRIKLPKLEKCVATDDNNIKNKIRKFLKIATIFVIAIVVAWRIINIIEPIINHECIVLTKSIANKVANEKAGEIMQNYRYDDLCSIERDSNR